MFEIAGASRVKIIGHGTRITLSGNNASAVGFSGTIDDLEIRGLTVIGDGIVGSTHRGFYNTNDASNIFSHFRFLDNSISGVTLGISVVADVSGSTNDILFDGNRLVNIVGTAVGQGYGIHHSGSTASANNVRIVNNYIETAQRHSIYQANGSGVVISNNTIRLHRDGVSIGGNRAAILVGRSSDVVVDGNTLDRPADGAITVSPGVTENSRNVVISNNVIFNPIDFYAINIGGQDPANEGIVEYINIVGNSVFKDATTVGDNFAALIIHSGLRVHIVGNSFYILRSTGVLHMMIIAGLGEATGTATFTDDIIIHSNLFYGTNGSGGATDGIRFEPLAADSGIQVDVISNRMNIPGNVFAMAVVQTDPNIRVFGTPTTGLTAALMASTLQVGAVLDSNVATGTAPFQVASRTRVTNLSTTTHPLVFDIAGAQVANTHITRGTATMSGGVVIVTFVGSAAFTNANSYNCAAVNRSNANPFRLERLAGTQIRLTGTGTDTIDFICVGN